MFDYILEFCDSPQNKLKSTEKEQIAQSLLEGIDRAEKANRTPKN